MSSTPRTDDLLLGDFEFDDDVVVALTNFARKLERENSELRQRLEAAEKDAARYRWLRNHAKTATERKNYEYGWFDVWAQHEPGFDSAIDAAMQEK